MKNFYDGQIFVITQIKPASAPGKCTCELTWSIGDDIAFCEWEPWGDRDFARMHVDCAKNHPNNKDNRIVNEVTNGNNPLTYSTQRACIDFIQDHPKESIEVIFHPRASKFVRYAYRVIK